MKVDYTKIAFAIATVVVSVLVGLGKLPPATLTTLLAWLLPSPAQGGQA